MTDLTVHRYGSPTAPTMVLLHGLTEDGTTWPDAVEHWGPGWSIVAPDLRGHGRSPRFATEQMGATAAVMYADVVGLIASLPEPPVLVGHSMGGFLAARLAHDAPGLVRAVVLEDPAKPMPKSAPHDPRFSQEQLLFVETVTTRPGSEIARMSAETSWSRAEIEAWAASKALVDRDYLRDGLQLLPGAWERGLFDELTVPTLVVVPVGGEMAPDMAMVGNPLVERVDIAGAGHCVRRDRPDAFFAAVDAFLSRL